MEDENKVSLEPLLGVLEGSRWYPLQRGQAAGSKFQARGGAGTVLSSGHSCPLFVTVPSLPRGEVLVGRPWLSRHTCPQQMPSERREEGVPSQGENREGLGMENTLSCARWIVLESVYCSYHH